MPSTNGGRLNCFPFTKIYNNKIENTWSANKKVWISNENQKHFHWNQFHRSDYVPFVHSLSSHERLCEWTSVSHINRWNEWECTVRFGQFYFFLISSVFIYSKLNWMNVLLNHLTEAFIFLIWICFFRFRNSEQRKTVLSFTRTNNNMLLKAKKNYFFSPHLIEWRNFSNSTIESHACGHFTTARVWNCLKTVQKIDRLWCAHRWNDDINSTKKK